MDYFYYNLQVKPQLHDAKINPSSFEERDLISQLHTIKAMGAQSWVEYNSTPWYRASVSIATSHSQPVPAAHSKHSEAQSPRIHLYPKNTPCYIQTQLHSGVGDSLMSDFNVSGR